MRNSPLPRVRLPETGKETTITPSASFYGLLFVSSADTDGVNASYTTRAQRITGYLTMAMRLATGLRQAFGRRLILLTNDAAFVNTLIPGDRRIRAAEILEVRELTFPDVLPGTARFFSASHKVLLFDFFARQSDYSVLLDLDMLCLPGAEDQLGRQITLGNPVVYDISSQVMPAYGADAVQGDLLALGPVPASFRWYGGEFIGGPPGFFAELSRRCLGVLPTYATVFPSLLHQGDEVLTSWSLNRIGADAGGFECVDLGASGYIRRHWGKDTRHDEPRLAAAPGLQFLHLPSLKTLLSSTLTDAQLLSLLRMVDKLPRPGAKYVFAMMGALLPQWR